jgi:hypothetical protein
MIEPPIAKGVFLCEAVIVEEETRNVSLINCFTRRVVDGFPSPLQQFYVFAIVTNGYGTMPLRMVVTDLNDGSELLAVIGVLEFSDPLDEKRALVPVKNLVFRHPGVYEVALESNGAYLTRARFKLESWEDVS